MSFLDAIKSVFSQISSYRGRARRSEFWFWSLFAVLLSIVVTVIGQVIGIPVTGRLVGFALILPNITVSVRRLHDTGRSGWWLLLGFTVVGIIPLIVWYALDSQWGTNPYGRSPKDAPAPSGVHRIPATDRGARVL